MKLSMKRKMNEISVSYKLMNTLTQIQLATNLYRNIKVKINHAHHYVLSCLNDSTWGISVLQAKLSRLSPVFGVTSNNCSFTH